MKVVYYMNRKNAEDLIPKPVSLWVDPSDAEEFKRLAIASGRTQRGLFTIVLKEGKRVLAESENITLSGPLSGTVKKRKQRKVKQKPSRMV